MKDPSLDLKHQRFVHEYVANGGNGPRAYRMVYRTCSPLAANTNASRLLKNADIRAYLADVKKKSLERLTPTYQKILSEYAKLAFSDIGECLDFDTPGGPYLIPGKYLSPEARACIAGVEVVTTTRSARASKAKTKGKAKSNAPAKTETITTTRIRVRLHDKKAALKDLAQHIGMFQELSPPEVFLNALPPKLANFIRSEVTKLQAATGDPEVLDQTRLGGQGETDPLTTGNVPGFGPYTRPVAEPLPGEHASPPNSSRVSSGGQEFRDGREDSAPLFDDP